MAQPSTRRLVTESALAIAQSAQDVALASHEARVDDLETLGGLAPGDVSDATVRNLVTNPASETGKTFAGIPISVTASPYNAVADYNTTTKTGTDQTAAFAAAFDAARAAKRAVHIPAGKFYVPGELNVSGLTIQGDLAGYYSRDGSVIGGDGTGITFNQQSTALGDITTNLSGLRFENVETAIRLTYSIYSTVADVSVIDALGDAIILGDNTIIGPIWNVFERVKANSLNGYGIVLRGKDWCNSNLFDTCYFKGTTGAVNINAVGGFGAVDNIFRNVEITGTGPGYVFDGITQATTIESGYIEPSGPAVVIRNTTSDLQLQGNVYGMSGNDVAGYGDRFIDHQSGVARVRVIGGWVTTAAGGRQDNMDFVGSDAPGSLNLELIAEPSQSVLSAGFRIMDESALSAATRTQRGSMTLQKHVGPALILQYPDGSRPFKILRNGTQGGTDFGVAFSNGAITSFTISNLGRLTLNEDLASAKITAATTPGTVTGKLAIRDANGNVAGYIPLYGAIT